MKRLLLVVAAASVLVSCAAAEKSIVPAGPSRPAQLLALFQVKGDPAGMSDADRVALESAAIKMVAAGSKMVEPVLSDIRANSDGDRRKALIKLLVLIEGRMAGNSSERTEADKRIERSAEKMLQSGNASDRYAGAILMALPTQSRLVEASLRLLDDEDAANRSFGNVMLRQIADIDMGYSPDAAPADRKAAVKRWCEWWGQNKDRAFYFMPKANPVLSSIMTESARIALQAGPYEVEVSGPDGKPVDDVVVAYSYYFTTFDGRGEKHQERLGTDANGRVLLGRQTVVTGMKFVGAQIVIVKMGFKDMPLIISPHVLTPNSFAIAVTLEPAT